MLALTLRLSAVARTASIFHHSVKINGGTLVADVQNITIMLLSAIHVI
jgi:hypothetical protein